MSADVAVRQRKRDDKVAQLPSAVEDLKSVDRTTAVGEISIAEIRADVMETSETQQQSGIAPPASVTTRSSRRLRSGTVGSSSSVVQKSPNKGTAVIPTTKSVRRTPPPPPTNARPNATVTITNSSGSTISSGRVVGADSPVRSSRATSLRATIAAARIEMESTRSSPVRPQSTSLAALTARTTRNDAIRVPATTNINTPSIVSYTNIIDVNTTASSAATINTSNDPIIASSTGSTISQAITKADTTTASGANITVSTANSVNTNTSSATAVSATIDSAAVKATANASVTLVPLKTSTTSLDAAGARLDAIAKRQSSRVQRQRATNGGTAESNIDTKATTAATTVTDVTEEPDSDDDMDSSGQPLPEPTDCTKRSSRKGVFKSIRKAMSASIGGSSSSASNKNSKRSTAVAVPNKRDALPNGSSKHSEVAATAAVAGERGVVGVVDADVAVPSPARSSLRSTVAGLLNRKSSSSDGRKSVSRNTNTKTTRDSVTSPAIDSTTAAGNDTNISGSSSNISGSGSGLKPRRRSSFMETVLSPFGSAVFGDSFGFLSDAATAAADGAQSSPVVPGRLDFAAAAMHVYYSDSSDDDNDEDKESAATDVNATNGVRLRQRTAQRGINFVTVRRSPEQQQQIQPQASVHSNAGSDTAVNITIAKPVPQVRSGEQLAILRILRLFALYSPTSAMRQFFQDVEPHVADWASALHFAFLAVKLFVELLLEIGYELYAWMKPYHPNKLAPAVMGLVMCFFGGSFVTVIAAGEAFRMCGYESTIKCVHSLMEEFRKVEAASHLDTDMGKRCSDYVGGPEVAAVSLAEVEAEAAIQSAQCELLEESGGSGDVGVQDMQEGSEQWLHSLSSSSAELPLQSLQPISGANCNAVAFATDETTATDSASVALSQSVADLESDDLAMGSKLFMFLQTVDPHKFTAAVVGINAGVVAVVATLKLQFARTVTLGNALAKTFEAPAKALLLPVLQLLLPKQFHKWADVLLTMAIKGAAVSVAWTMRRVIASYHSALRGGLLFVKHSLEYLVAMGFCRKQARSFGRSFAGKCLGYAIAALGIWFQLSYGFTLPFPLNVILFPFTMLEYLLVWLVNNSSFILNHGAAAAASL